MSMKSLAGLISVLGAGYVGYNKGLDIKDQRVKDDERYADEKDQRQAAKEQRDIDRKVRNDVAASQKDVVPENVTLAPVVENSTMPDGTPAAPLVDGQAPVVSPAQGVTRLGKQTFTDPAAAAQAAMGINSEASKMQRAAQIHAEAGDIDKAKKYQDFAKNAINEGSDKLLTAIQSAAPSLDALKKAKGGTVQGTIGADAADVFNKTGGKWKVAPDTKVEHYIEKDAAGREFVNSRILDKEGKPVVESTRHAQMMLADMKTRLEQENKATEAFQKGQQLTETGRHNVAEERNQAVVANTGAQRLAMEKEQFKRQSLDGQISQIESVIGPLKPDDRKAMGMQLAGLGKDSQAIGKFADTVVMEGVKAGTVKAEDAMKLRTQIIQSKQMGDHEAEVFGELSANKDDPAKYAESYAGALKLGMPAAKLAERGFTPPKQVATVKQAANLGAKGSAAQLQSDDETSRTWIRNKLMGALDGPDKLKEIAKSSKNPDFRRVAAQMYEEEMAKKRDFGNDIPSAPL